MHTAMSVIADISLPAGEFELGRILRLEQDASIALETLVPLGEQPVPFFRFYGSGRSTFEERVRGHAHVTDIHEVTVTDDETLYAPEWDTSEDDFLREVSERGAHVLEATGRAEAWSFRIRFDSHETLSGFLGACADADIDIEIKGVYNPTTPEAEPWYGMTPRQRETLIRAVAAGYYAIPRECSTQDLAEEFGISDQAVTERLRRGIATLVTNTLGVPERDD